MDRPLRLRCSDCHQEFVVSQGANGLSFRCIVCATPVDIFDELDDDAVDQ